MSAVFLMAYDRPEFLEKVLQSWECVRGLERWEFVGRVDPNPKQDESVELLNDFIRRRGLTNARVIVNETKHGVLHHPWVGFTEAFQDHEFVVYTEDDSRVSDDILEYFEWAQKSFLEDQRIASVHAFSDEVFGASRDAHLRQVFHPWTWGTWKDRWEQFIGPTWDHDYSTFNAVPGNQSGYDWNLNTRVYPEHDKLAVFPKLSRVDNIGVYGVHSTEEIWEPTKTFHEQYGKLNYELR